MRNSLISGGDASSRERRGGERDSGRLARGSAGQPGRADLARVPGAGLRDVALVHSLSTGYTPRLVLEKACIAGFKQEPRTSASSRLLGPTLSSAPPRTSPYPLAPSAGPLTVPPTPPLIIRCSAPLPVAPPSIGRRVPHTPPLSSPIGAFFTLNPAAPTAPPP